MDLGQNTELLERWNFKYNFPEFLFVRSSMKYYIATLLYVYFDPTRLQMKSRHSREKIFKKKNLPIFLKISKQYS